MRTLPAVSACVFDAFGTLIDLAPLEHRLERSLGTLGREVAAVWRRKQLEYAWLRTLTECFADFDTVTEDALGHALAACGASEQQDVFEALRRAYHELPPYQDIVAALDRLWRGGVPCVVLSNGSSAMLHSLFGAPPLRSYFRHLCSVDACRAYKPAPRAYALATERLQLSAAQVAFVSSNTWDIHGATSFGFQTIWLNRGGTTCDRLPGTHAAEVSSLAEVADLLLG